MADFYGIPPESAAEYAAAVARYDAAVKAAMATLASKCAPVARFGPNAYRPNPAKYDPVAGPANAEYQAAIDAAAAAVAAEAERLGVVLD